MWEGLIKELEQTGVKENRKLLKFYRRDGEGLYLVSRSRYKEEQKGSTF